MKINSGLFDHCVLQRTASNASDVILTGKGAGSGAVIARITKDAHVTPNFDGVPIGQCVDGLISARLAGLPSGGPYAIELSIEGSPHDKTVISDILVGDVWVLAGQSNMQGCGLIKYAAPAHTEVRAFFMDDRWAVARDPLHNLWQAVDPVHIALNGGVPHQPATETGCGPGVAFGQSMHQRTGVPQGLLACAHGGTSMHQWDPGARDAGGKSLYGAMIRRIQKNGGRVAGLVWYQGESDANAEAAPKYTQRMREFVAAVRNDLKAPQLPIALVQISRVVGSDLASIRHWNAIQEMQRNLPETIDRCRVVPAIDLPLDDLIHIGSTGCNRLGNRLADAMLSIIDPGTKPPIAVKSISLDVDPRNNLGRLAVEFDNVHGALQSGTSRPVGFAVVESQSQLFPAIYNIDLEGNRAIIHLTTAPSDAQGFSLYYGFGLDPICNITDGADRSLPVFGPVHLGVPQARTGFPRRAQVSAVQPSAEKLHALRYPENMTELKFQPRQFNGRFSDLHADLGALAPKDVVVYFRYAVSCSESMKLNVLLGYDGPVKLWIDGNDAFHDPAGVNPAVVDAKTVPWSAAAGNHEILIALGSNHGAAWGIYFRIERTDVGTKELAENPPAYAMPELQEA